MEYFSLIKRKNSICIISMLEHRDEEQIVGCQGEGWEAEGYMKRQQREFCGKVRVEYHDHGGSYPVLNL